MGRLAITIEGGLISSDLVEQIAATPQDVVGQRPADFSLDARLSDEIQKAFSDAMIHWNAFNARITRGKESATTITRETWVLPLLEELGFTLVFQRAAVAAGGSTFVISHRLGNDPAAPPVHIVSSEQELDRRGDAARSPHALVQDYLNRSDALWGIVTNGMKLRLLRNTVRFSKPSFIEFDLEAIFNANLYSEFVPFYRLVHATRLPRSAGDAHECWLEKYYQQGIEQGGRVRERLRDGVEEALHILGTGLLAHPGSAGLRASFESRTLSKIGYYRQLLRLIYRLLFLMVAEERRLLFLRDTKIADRQEIYDRWYSIERLRKRADDRFSYESHSDLWEGLKQTFRLFEDTANASQLGLTALDGELFGRLACADLIDSTDTAGPKLSNRELLSAIWHLSTFEDADGHRKSGVRRRVNFAGLDVEELGSVYESLLDYHPEVTIDGESSKFALVAGTERKATGSYYTPPELVRELIKSALEPVIEDRIAKAATREEKERALLSLKICDPASGSGHFMLAAARRLGRELSRVRTGEVEPNPADYRHAIRDVIRRCIYAVDKNPLAVDLCKVALWIEGHEPGLPLSFLDHHVKCGDSLFGVFDLDILRAGVPDGAYNAVTGDDKAVAKEIKKHNQADAKALFRYSIQDSVDRIAVAFAAIADLPETTPQGVRDKEAAYAGLREGDDWKRAKWACDLWTATFFAPLTKDRIAAVPTTRHVWEAAGGHLPKGSLAQLTFDLAVRQPFFHWLLEFPEVFAAGGFDIMLGNPPWERIKLQEKEFFAARDRAIAEAPNKVARERLIRALSASGATPEKKALAREWELAKHAAECESKFVRESGRYPLTAFGDINTYAIFAETFLRGLHARGRAGFIVPTGIATENATKTFFGHITSTKRLAELFDFENTENLFRSVATLVRFALLTLANNVETTDFIFCASNVSHLADTRRRFTLRSDEIALLNPNTKTAPAFRSKADAELAKKIYSRIPVLIDFSSAEAVNPWGISFRQGLFHMTNDSGSFNTSSQLAEAGATQDGTLWRSKDENYLPLYEAKMMQVYDHRFGTYAPGQIADTRALPRLTDAQYADPSFEVNPRYYVSESALQDRLAGVWDRKWLLCFRSMSNHTNVRRFIPGILPYAGVGNSLTVVTAARVEDRRLFACLCANFSSMIADVIARWKISGTNVNIFYVEQFPILPPTTYGAAEFNFVVPRVVELAYTSLAMRPFAQDIGYHGEPFTWNANRRAQLRAELDAFYGYLYGLTRRELEYILDPKMVMGEDYPSETFRVLKEREEGAFGEYRTKRLVLEAWDHFAADGTFDPARLREPQYIDRVAQELAATRARLDQVEHDSKTLIELASATPKPTLFVEGATDAKIIEAAWSVFFPDELMPMKVIAAGGTKEMGSLAGKGKALREVLGGQVVLVLADNDSAGRLLTEDGHVRKGGIWRQLQNGIHWCLLRPTASFASAMKAHNVPTDYWPFTIEAAFAPTLRRQAEADGAWRFSGTPQAELLDNPDLARRLFALLPKLGQDDDTFWYLMAPHPETKDAFASWVTAPEQRTEENYAAFEEIVRGLRAVLVDNDKSEGTIRTRGAA